MFKSKYYSYQVSQTQIPGEHQKLVLLHFGCLETPSGELGVGGLQDSYHSSCCFPFLSRSPEENISYCHSNYNVLDDHIFRAAYTLLGPIFSSLWKISPIINNSLKIIMLCTNQHIYHQIVYSKIGVQNKQINGHIRQITCSFKIIFKARIVKLGR